LATPEAGLATDMALVSPSPRVARRGPFAGAGASAPTGRGSGWRKSGSSPRSHICRTRIIRLYAMAGEDLVDLRGHRARPDRLPRRIGQVVFRIGVWRGHRRSNAYMMAGTVSVFALAIFVITAGAAGWVFAMNTVPELVSQPNEMIPSSHGVPATADGILVNFSNWSGYTGMCGPTPIVQWVNLSGSAIGGTPPYNYTWYFGGVFANGTSVMYGQDVQHEFHVWGPYYVTLRVVDARGIDGSIAKELGTYPDCSVMPPVSSPVGNSAIVWYVGCGILTILVVAGVLVYRKRSKEY
jgi:hypothetical protein